MMKRICIITAYVLSALMLLAGCASNSAEDAAKKAIVYYPDENYAELLSLERTVLSDTIEGEVDELSRALATEPLIDHMIPVLNDDVYIKSRTISGNLLRVDMSASYNALSKTQEVLTRAAVVETLTQVDGISYVELSVNGVPLADEDERPYGPMRGDSFINDTASEISTYDRRRITLYFADMEGYHLTKTARTVVYTANMSTEKLIVQKLIEGPENGEDVYPTIPKDTQLLSVTTKNGVCYVNFNAAIREKPYTVAENVVIYSIVDSLTELSNIDKVQILVEGVSDGTLYDSMSLDRLYERDTDIIK
ncbi:MAG: GerMN domain-containing protein [Lachnospiraceae bacterium]|nr:GerMN domain-containing protein [Lachnospiraceae bacterium]